MSEELYDVSVMSNGRAREFCTPEELKDLPEGTITFGLYLHAEEREQSESYWREKIAGEIEASHKPQKMESDPSAEWHFGCHHGDCFHFESAAIARKGVE